MARGNNQKQSSARSEIGGDFTFSLHQQSGDFQIGNEIFFTKAPQGMGDELNLRNALMALKGLSLLPSGLGGGKATNLALLGYAKERLVNTPFGKATTQNGNSSISGYSIRYKKADFSKKASGLADLLNDMVFKGQGGSKLFKEVDSLYQKMKIARDSGNVGKTTELNGGRVSDVSGDNFQLSRKGTFTNGKLFFRPMQKAELTAGEMYTFANDIQSLVRRISDRSTTVPIGETTDKYLPARYNGVSDIDSPSWFKISLKRNDTGFEPVKVKFITSNYEREKAKTSYRDGNNY